MSSSREAMEVRACSRKRVDLLVGQIGNLPEVVGGRGGEKFGGGIAFAKREDPAVGDVLDEQREFGEGERQEMVKLIDEARALAYDGLEPTGDLTEGAQLGGHD